LPLYAANRWLSIRLELCGNCIATFSALAAATAPFYLPSFNNETALLVAFALSQALSVTNTLGWSVRMWCDVEGAMNSVERVEEYAKLQPEAAAHVPDRDIEGWPSHGKIMFRDACMRYRIGLPLVLNQTSFEIKGGEKCGVVGRTGSGKSSIIVALFRLSELCGGSIMIDCQNIAEMGLQLIRKSISIVPQDPVLFATSVRNNLDPLCAHSDESVRLPHMHNVFVSWSCRL
jgi:ATP-binding cassette, subfamily C (CFTR/MRP), member 1